MPRNIQQKCVRLSTSTRWMISTRGNFLPSMNVLHLYTWIKVWFINGLYFFFFIHSFKSNYYTSLSHSLVNRLLALHKEKCSSMLLSIVQLHDFFPSTLRDHWWKFERSFRRESVLEIVLLSIEQYNALLWYFNKKHAEWKVKF